MSQKRGMGSVYQRGNRWWIDYHHHGKRFREPVLEAENEAQASRKLKQRLGEIHTGRFIGPSEEKLSFDDLVKLIEDEYTLKERRSTESMKIYVKHLREYFGFDRAVDITGSRIKAYQVHRKNQKASNATINRETATLHHMLVLAVDDNKLARAAKVEMLPENNVRQGFVSWADFDKILVQVQEQWRKNTIEFLFLTGWRSGKVKDLEWRQVFLNDEQPWIKLDGGSMTKKSGRDLPLTGRLLEIINEQSELRRLDCPFVFHNSGHKIGNFRKAWLTACTAAGFGKILPHDFRRSLARNLTAAGVSQQVIMARAGWRTASTFTRYRIVDMTDQISANQAAELARSQASSSKIEAISNTRT